VKATFHQTALQSQVEEGGESPGSFSRSKKYVSLSRSGMPLARKHALLYIPVVYKRCFSQSLHDKNETYALMTFLLLIHQSCDMNFLSLCLRV